MRKYLPILALVAIFTTGFLVGLDTGDAEAASDKNCFWTCGCNGVPIKCCSTPFGVICSEDPEGPVQCPQIADC
jgi:hypothetical protein